MFVIVFIEFASTNVNIRVASDTSTGQALLQLLAGSVARSRELARSGVIGYLISLQTVEKAGAALIEENHIVNDCEVSIVIVNYNCGQDILDCLQSLRQCSTSEVHEIIVVDNNSTDGSPAQIASQFPEVKLHVLGENRGFAAACNVGIEAARAATVLLLNPDTIVKRDAVGKMLGALRQNPTWGIVGAKMVKDGSIPYRAARRFPQPRDLGFAAMGLAKLFSGSRYFNGYLYGETPIEELDSVDQVEGSCLMISAAARSKVGNLDERFFIFFEEVDWCKRVKAAGFEIHIVQEAEVVHKISATMGKYYEFTRRIHAQSGMKYFCKHAGEEGFQSIRKVMKRALLIRATLLVIPAMLNFGQTRRRLAGTLAERRTYIEGLKD